MPTAMAFDVTDPPAIPDVCYPSTTDNGTLGGLSLTPADIVRYTRSSNTATKVYDARHGRQEHSRHGPAK